MYTIPLISIIGCSIFILFTKIFLLFQSANSSRKHASPSAIIDLLSSKASSTVDLLESRALANQRLLRAFQLTNTFVSPDITVHGAFVRQIKELLREQSHRSPGERQWASFLDVSRQAVASELNSFHDDGTSKSACAFAEVVQIVTLKAIIVGLLDLDRNMDTLNAEDLRSSATLIMKLWTSSKTASSGNEAELSKLNYHLRNLLPDAEKYPNPINFVIPTWETLWRLVATCLARVYDNAEYCHVFEEFLRDPTSRRFHDHSDSTSSSVGYSDGLCADFIINETLRLHPPSRHISRSFPIETPSISIPVPKLTFVGGWPVLTLDWRHRTQIQTEVADIEAAHLSTDIWGMNALTFEPRRWALHADKDAPTLFVFGHGPLMCVGKKWAPMAAAIIVGAILECIKADGLEIVGGRSIGGREGWDDWMIQSFET